MIQNGRFISVKSTSASRSVVNTIKFNFGKRILLSSLCMVKLDKQNVLHKVSKADLGSFMYMVDATVNVLY